MLGSNPRTRVPTSFHCILAPLPPASLQKWCGYLSLRNGGQGVGQKEGGAELEHPGSLHWSEGLGWNGGGEKN